MRVVFQARRRRVDRHQRADPVRPRARGDQLPAPRSTGTSACSPTPAGSRGASASTCARSSSAASIMGSVAMLVAVPFGLGTAIYLSEYAPRRVRRIVKPIIEVLAGIPSVIVGFFVLNFVAPERGQPVLRPAAGRQEHARRRPRHRHPRHPDHGVGLRGRPERGAQLAARGQLRLRRPQGQHGRSASCSRRRCRASSPPSSSPCPGRSARRWSPRWPAGYDGAGPYNGLNPLNPGLSMTGGDDQRRRRHRPDRRAARRSRCCSSSACCCS